MNVLTVLAWCAGLLIGLGVLSFGALLLAAHGGSSVVYKVSSFVELQRYLGTWAPLLDERADILVSSPALFEPIHFRKKRFKSRPDELIYRFRYHPRRSAEFAAVVERLEKEGLTYEVELTKKRRQPRAVIVKLDADDMLAASAATHLCRATFEALRLGSDEIHVSATGRIRQDADRSGLAEVPMTRAHLAGLRFGRAIRRLVDFIGG